MVWILAFSYSLPYFFYVVFHFFQNKLCSSSSIDTTSLAYTYTVNFQYCGILSSTFVRYTLGSRYNDLYLLPYGYSSSCIDSETERQYLICSILYAVCKSGDGCIYTACISHYAAK